MRSAIYISLAVDVLIFAAIALLVLEVRKAPMAPSAAPTDGRLTEVFLAHAQPVDDRPRPIRIRPFTRDLRALPVRFHATEELMHMLSALKVEFSDPKGKKK